MNEENRSKIKKYIRPSVRKLFLERDLFTPKNMEAVRFVLHNSRKGGTFDVYVHNKQIVQV